LAQVTERLKGSLKSLKGLTCCFRVRKLNAVVKRPAYFSNFAHFIDFAYFPNFFDFANFANFSDFVNFVSFAYTS
jgi:hypothetical protein